MIACIACLIGFDAQKGQVFRDRIFKFSFLFCRVCIVETKNESASVHVVGEVIVHQGSLCVADVKIATMSIQQQP